MTYQRPNVRGDAELLDDLALHAGTLAAHPRNAAARARVRLLVAEVAAIRKAERLVRAAEAADAEARETPGYRADLEG